jgi:pimeloyl-ACP methyl ester carboxylesterase
MQRVRRNGSVVRPERARWVEVSLLEAGLSRDSTNTPARGNLAKIDVPTLVVHGTDDRILPFEATAARLSELIADVTIVQIEGGPHNIGWTHPKEVNGVLLGFLAGTAATLESTV